MNVLFAFLAGAIEANFDLYSEPLIDEGWWMVCDDALAFLAKHRDATEEEARAAGAYRVTNATEWDARYL